LLNKPQHRPLHWHQRKNCWDRHLCTSLWYFRQIMSRGIPLRIYLFHLYRRSSWLLGISSRNF